MPPNRVSETITHVTQRANLDYIEEVRWSRIFLQVEQNNNWLRNGFFTNWGLHHNQDFPGGELQKWMKKWHDNTSC